MADFDKALKYILSKQGDHANYLESEDSNDDFLLCSNCFNDEGLSLDALRVGIKQEGKCPNCCSEEGHKLNKLLIKELCYRFFVKGTIEKCKYGGFPLIQFNKHRYNNSDIKISPWLVNDVKLIESCGEIGLFYYGPRFWMFGEIEPLKSLQNKKEREKIIERILKTYPSRELTQQDYFYRLRCNPKVSHSILEYDTAPSNFVGLGRFDDEGFPVLYGSSDIELCIHECRSRAEDSLFVGKLVPCKTLKVLDLSALLEEEGTEFESLDIAIHFLFLAGKHSYDICRRIAAKARESGFDGIIYPSYFSYLRTGGIPFDTVYGMSIRKISELKTYAEHQSIPNLALFGRPIDEGKVSVECINKVIINQVVYDISFGPSNIEPFMEDGYKEKRIKIYEDRIKSLLNKKAE